ncbi:MAG TPA: DUF2007 domain-containing protein [Pirellulales bacterium]|nr:DUF2007 domain-containing protein [Pirellulales bacterium]
MPAELIPVATFVKPAEAVAARCALEAQGITCFLKDENLVAMNWLYGNAVGYVKLLVAEPDAERALTLLETPYDDWPTSAQPETWKCRQCGEEVENRSDRCTQCGTPRHPEDAVGHSHSAAVRDLLRARDESAEQDKNPYASPRADVARADDKTDGRAADDEGPRARCPECGRPRMAVCPFCETSGTTFRGANPLDEGSMEEPSLLICSLCDEPFEASYLRRCEWCGHDFGAGLEVPAVMQTVSRDAPNWRVFLVGICGVAIIVGLITYFAMLLS